MASSDDTSSGPSFWSGLMAGLNNTANDLPTNGLFNVGMGLMQAAAPFGNVGTSLMNANQQTLQNQAARQKLGMGSLQMKQAMAEFPLRMAWLKAAGQSMPGQLGTQSPQQGPGLAPANNAAPPGIALPPDQQQTPQPPAPNQYRPLPPITAVGGDPIADYNMGKFGAALGMQGSEAFLNAPKNAQAAQEYITKQRQLQTTQPLATLDSLATASNADQLIKSDPELSQRWTELAPRLGLNPDPNTATPENGRAFGRFAYNEIAGSAQQPPKPMPDIFDQIPGANGQLIQRNRTTGAVTEPIPQKLPTYALQKSWDPTTGREVGIMVQTSPGGSAAPSAALSGTQSRSTSVRPAQGQRPTIPQAATAPTTGGLGQQATAPVDLGFEKPTDTQLKVATLANYARSSIPTMGKLEATGYRMSPTTRTAVIDAATNDDPSKLSQWMSQEMLAHKLSSQDLQYMGALMPFLQAAGHDMSGARLTTAAMRQAFESTIPVDSKDPAYMATIANNRKQLYSGLLAGSGNASQVPEFKTTLGADRAQLAGAGKLPVKVASPAQAMALQPGTVFITPDGRLKVR
jgi:hypothetical protein